MTLDFSRILSSKRKLRRQLAAKPIAEKLAMLDSLRERTLQLRASGQRSVGAKRPMR